MKCPNCGQNIQFLSKECISCRKAYDETTYDKLDVYFGVKKELEGLIALKVQFEKGLSSIAGKINKYQSYLEKELQLSSEKDSQRFIPHDSPIRKEYEQIVLEESKLEEEKKVNVHSEFSFLKEKEESDFEIRLGQKWLLIIGIVTMVFGIGYFLKYSFEKWIFSPSVKVLLVYVWGGIFLGIGGYLQRNVFKIYGLFLMGGGIAVLYFAAFAGHHVFNLHSQPTAFIIMILITLSAGVLAVLTDNKWLAVLGLIGGFLTPVLLSTGKDNQIGLMTYMCILNLGLLGIAFWKRWNLLNILGFIFTYVLFSAWFFHQYDNSKFTTTLFFLNIFFLIYAVIQFVYLFLREEGDRLMGYFIIIPNSFIAFAYSYILIRGYTDSRWISLVSISYGLVYLAMWFLLYLKGKRDLKAFVVLIVQSAVFFIVTIPLLFAEQWVTLFWIVQGIALIWMSNRLENTSLSILAILLFFITIIKFIGYDYPRIFHLNWYYFSNQYIYMLLERLITSIFLLAGTYGYYAILKRSSNIKNIQQSFQSMFYGFWLTLLFIVLNIEVMAFFHDYLNEALFASISVLWALYSVGLMISGFKYRRSSLRTVSLILFFFTVLKVFFVDTAHFKTPYRILSFIILGMLLIGTSYFYYRFKYRILSAISNDNSKNNNPSE